MKSYSDLIGIKYKSHGRNKEEGFDCYGLAIEVLRRNGITLIDVFYKEVNKDENKKTINKAKEIIPHIVLEKPLENSIIELSVYGEPSHIAVYIGDGYIIHATQNKGVVIEPLHIYKNRIRGIYKV